MSQISRYFKKLTKKKLQNYSPRLGTVIFEAFSLRKYNFMKYTTRQQFQEETRPTPISRVRDLQTKNDLE